jgi:hypothetical protein
VPLVHGVHDHDEYDNGTAKQEELLGQRHAITYRNQRKRTIEETERSM